MDLLGLSAYDSAEDERDDDEKDVNEDGKETRTNDISAIPSSLTISKEAHETKSIISHAEMVEMSSQTTGADSIKATAPDVVESKRRRLAFVHEIPNYLADAVPNEETVSTIRQYLDAQQLHDFSLTNSIRSKKEFGNPYILTKIIDYFAIDEIGSNYPRELFDPHGYEQSDYIDRIRQKTLPVGGASAAAPTTDPDTSAFSSSQAMISRLIASASNVATTTATAAAASKLTSSKATDVTDEGRRRKSRFSERNG